MARNVRLLDADESLGKGGATRDGFVADIDHFALPVLSRWERLGWGMPWIIGG